MAVRDWQQRTRRSIRGRCISAAGYTRCATSWDAPREKSKRTDIAIVLLTTLIAAAAIISAWIFQRQLTATITSMQVSERAWVGMVNVNTPDKVTTGVRFRAFTSIHNFGRSPARRVSSAINTKIFCTPFPEDPPYRDSNTQFFQSGSPESSDVVMPGHG